MVGYLSYDLVRRFERLPATAADDLPLPELGMMLATDLVVLDHYDGSAILVANAVLRRRRRRRGRAAPPTTRRWAGSTR